MAKRHRGLHYARTKAPHNRLEKRFARAWEDENEDTQGKPGLQKNLLEYLLSPDNKRADVSDRDCEVAATVVQWLGTPIGVRFLERLGFHNTPGIAHIVLWAIEDHWATQSTPYKRQGIIDDTGLHHRRIDKALQRLRKDGRIFYDSKEGWKRA